MTQAAGSFGGWGGDLSGSAPRVSQMPPIYEVASTPPTGPTLERRAPHDAPADSWPPTLLPQGASPQNPALPDPTPSLRRERTTTFDRKRLSRQYRVQVRQQRLRPPAAGPSAQWREGSRRAPP